MIKPKKVKKLSERIGRNLHGHSAPNVGAAISTILADFADKLPVTDMEKIAAIDCIAGDAKSLVLERNQKSQ